VRTPKTEKRVGEKPTPGARSLHNKKVADEFLLPYFYIYKKDKI
jgi:hypothetical protein